MAELAGRGKTYLDVVDRGGGGVVIVEVARNACRVRAGQVVVVVDMAIGTGAWRNGVGVGQRKSCGGVIELAISPNYRVVAALAGGGEAHLDVVHRRGGGVVILQVAR